jgi:signal transduction histidine kinase
VAGAARVDVALAGDLENLPPAVAAAIYRIAQESITNATRHARDATRIEVRVTGDRDAVRLTVRDDGGVVVANGAGGYGLAGMAERATLLGGTLVAGPAPGRGWSVDAVVPRAGTAA